MERAYIEWFEGDVLARAIQSPRPKLERSALLLLFPSSLDTLEPSKRHDESAFDLLPNTTHQAYL